MARLVVAHRFEHGDIGPLAVCGGAPFSLSILRTVSRNPRSSSALAPTMLRAMIEDEAWPSAQAFTSWAKSVTVSPSIFRSTVTVEPQSFEWAVALASGAAKPADPRNCPGQLDNAAIIDLIEHCRTANLPGRALVYCLHPPIDYIGADVVELKFGPGAETPAFVPRDWRDNGRRYQATLCRAVDHVHTTPVPVERRPSREEAEAAVRALIAYIGDNPTREGLQATPKRVVAALDELYRGYREVPAKALVRTFGETEPYDDFVLIRDIGFTSHCEHHMMPFYGKAHVAYRPVERVVGLSKLARLVDVYARRLQTQEQLTSQVAAAIEDVLKPHGVAVLIEAEHTCMSVRGVSKPGVSTVTTRFLGTFRDSPEDQMRFVTLVRSAAAAG